MSDNVTVLSSFGPLLTKRWTKNGIQPYDRAKRFKATVHDVKNIEALSSLLTALEKAPRSCVIRGLPRDGIGLNEVTRSLGNFYEAPHHWVCFDVDNWPTTIEDPQAAVKAFIESCLPDEFHHASYHWQLSASAGSKAGVLKAHLWFWLEQPCGEEELTAWVRAKGLPIDHTIFRTVQVHYTAAPVIDEGVECPVTLRSGFVAGLLYEAVPLDLSRQQQQQRRKIQVDPTEKSGLVGAFCRAYPPQRAIDELLNDVFEWENGDGRRLTWLKGGGSPGGAVVTDDGQHIYNSHATDPAEGRAVNTFDLVRLHRFGDLDQGLEDLPIREKPSYARMVAFARSLPDLKVRRPSADEDFGEQDVESAIAEINAATTTAELESAAKRLASSDWSPTETPRLVCSVQKRYRELTGARLPVGTAREMLVPQKDDKQIPEWLSRWVLIASAAEKVFNMDDRLIYSRTGFSNAILEHAPMRSEGDGHVDPWKWVMSTWQMRSAFGVAYAPGMPELFEWEGKTLANTYRKSSEPQPAKSANHPAVEAVERHLARMFPDERERSLLVSWMAHQVRATGTKTRWAPYIFGAQGTGKTFLSVVLAAAMGEENVKVISGTDLKSDFNSWVSGAAVVVIEEVYAVGHRFDIVEKLKAPISNDTVSVHKKGIDLYQAPNMTNYMLLSNHVDGIPIDRGDRRFMVLEVAITAEQAAALDEEGYFSNLFAAVRSPDAGGALRRWLLDVEMHPDCDPHGRAPETKAKEIAVIMSRDEVEQSIADLVTGRKAVTIGWIRETLASEHGLRVPQGRAIAHIMARIGFVQALRSPIWVNGKARRIYVPEAERDASPERLREMLGIEINLSGEAS